MKLPPSAPPVAQQRVAVAEALPAPRPTQDRARDVPACAADWRAVTRRPVMPFVTVTVRKPKSSAFETNVLDAVHAGLVGSGVPETDRFQRVLELDAEDFRFDPGYPDLESKRSDDFVLIEIVWSVGRSVKVKKKLLADLMTRLSAQGLDPEQVMVCFKETSWENWSFGGGRLIHT
jgi:phenylpyruvate tautomerase PptA (4-oxalocrotonate tautomerase family)